MPDQLLELPLGLRLWPQNTGDEPFRFVEGYTLSPLENTTDSYRFSIMVNAGKFPQVLAALAPKLPDETFFILEFYQDDQPADPAQNPTPKIYYSPYLPTAEILETIEPFLPRLVHDGFVGFGLANNREGVELFYSEEKVLTCFTGNHLRVTDLLAHMQIPNRADLQFPTDTGHDHLSLLCHQRKSLPEPFCSMTETELDYTSFCDDLTELLDMYPVEDDFSFFLSKKEQDQIEARLAEHPEYAEFADDDFGGLLLDWNDFVDECAAGFQGDLWEYHQGLKLRDLIEFVIVGVPQPLGSKINEIVSETDQKLQQNLVDRRKRLDPPCDGLPIREDRFWYQGIVCNQGVPLRRDLIRQGWFNR
ncbi:hypothetical protein [Trichloromonas sp.]|uniref:hypothetical protein n=1 Tax=Trichloromonas sp. TaxID=3069249 RepID=UPI003D815078